MSDAPPLPVLDDLSFHEQQLIEAARRGESLDCSDLDVEELAASDEPDHLVRADVLRELLLGRRGPLDPRGVRLRGAKIVGRLDLDHSVAVAGLGLERCVLVEPISMLYMQLPWLHLSRCNIHNLHADGMRTDANLQLHEVRSEQPHPRGTISLAGAHIGGQLSVAGTEIANIAGPALFADGLQVDTDLHVSASRMSGSGENGAIRLVGARVGSQLVLSGAEVTNNAGIALTGDGLQVETDFYVINSCLSGTGLNAPVHLSGARVGGQLWFQKTTISNTAEVKVIFNNVPAAPVHVDSTAINLRNATVGGPVIISIKELACPSPTRGGVTCPHSTKVELNGFTFGALDQVHWWEWLHLIRCHTWSYRPQPYQQLATTEREAGHDGNARQILIAQQQDLYHRAPKAFGSWWVRKFHWLWGVLAGYGYRVRRIALALLVALTTASGIGVVAGHIGTTPDHYAAERIVSFSQQTGQPCSTVELIGVGLDRGLPLAPTGVRARCDINTTTGWGQILTIAIWIVQAGIWSLATLALAGYTSLVRRPT